MDAANELRKDLRNHAVMHGRKASDVRLIPDLSFFLAPTRKEAEELFTYTHARKLVSIKEVTGLDLTDWPEDCPVRAEDLPPAPVKVGSKTHAGLLELLIRREEPLCFPICYVGLRLSVRVIDR